MSATIPVILSGGVGARLWPLSGTSAPKQMQPLLGPDTMLRSTLARVEHLDARVVIVTSTGHLDRVVAQIPADRRHLVVGEPIGRNTAPAVAAAALTSAPDDVLLVLPADHYIGDVPAFRRAVDTALEVAARGRLVAFGVAPVRAETGYGYIVPSSSAVPHLAEPNGVRLIERFYEKPGAAMVSDLIQTGALWNSGMFVFPVGLLIEELARHAPAVLEHVEKSLPASAAGGSTIALGPQFALAPAISIDVAVMEPTDRGAVVFLDAGWTDVGSWESLWELSEKDPRGNVQVGDVVAVDSADNYLRSEGPLIAAIGIEGMVVVATGNEVLIVPRERAQEVKGLAEMLKVRAKAEEGAVDLLSTD